MLAFAIAATALPLVEFRSDPMPSVEIAPGVKMPLAGFGTWQYNSSLAESSVVRRSGDPLPRRASTACRGSREPEVHRGVKLPHTEGRAFETCLAGDGAVARLPAH